LQVAKVRLDLVEEPPGARALGRQQAPAMLEPTRGASGDGADDMQVGEQGLGRRRLGSHRRARRVVGDAEHEERIGEDEGARGLRPRDVDLIEASDLACGEPVRRHRLDEAHAVGRVGARQRHEIFHRGVRDELAVLDVVLHGFRERPHQPEAPRHPAHAAIEAARQDVEGQAMILMQRAQQPALLERAVGRVGAQELLKDQGLRLRHLPDDGGDRVALQPAEAADALVAVDDHIRRARGHDHDGHLLAGIGQRGQEVAFARRLLHPQPLVPPIELMKFQVHGPSVRWRLLSHRADRVLQGASGKSDATGNTVSHLTGGLVLRGSRGKSARFPCRINDLPRLLVLRSHEQDSTQVAEEISADHAEGLLSEIPRQLRERGREHQRQDRGLGLVGRQPPALDAMRDEVVGITTTPGRLCPCAPRDLTRRGRTGTLATANPPAGRKPMAADAARPLREHPQMLASSAGNEGGQFLASNPGSILASAEGCSQTPPLSLLRTTIPPAIRRHRLMISTLLAASLSPETCLVSRCWITSSSATAATTVSKRADCCRTAAREPQPRKGFARHRHRLGTSPRGNLRGETMPRCSHGWRRCEQLHRSASMARRGRRLARGGTTLAIPQRVLPPVDQAIVAAHWTLPHDVS